MRITTTFAVVCIASTLPFETIAAPKACSGERLQTNVQEDALHPCTTNVIRHYGDGRLPEGSGPLAKDNRVPVIWGSPPLSVRQGSPYTFTPNAADADGDPLSFNVTGLPSWANFDRNTGMLSGVPQSGDAGVYGNIVITVVDGAEAAVLAPFYIVVDQSTVGRLRSQ